MAWTDGRCSNCGAMLTTGGCPFCARPTLIVTVTGHTEYVDPRDAEIARLKAEVERLAYELAIVRRNLDCARDDHDADLAAHKRALAAVVAWLRASNKSRDYDLATAIERGEHEEKKP